MTLADDLVQEALLKAWSNADKFQRGTSIRAWLFTILRNVYYSQYRKRAREVQDTDGVYSRAIAVEGDQESHLDLVDFRKALARLPAEQREVLMLVGASGLSYEEASAVCGVEIGTIKSRLSRARAKLAELMELNEPHSGAPARAARAVGPIGRRDDRTGEIGLIRFFPAQNNPRVIPGNILVARRWFRSGRIGRVAPREAGRGSWVKVVRARSRLSKRLGRRARRSPSDSSRRGRWRFWR